MTARGDQLTGRTRVIPTPSRHTLGLLVLAMAGLAAGLVLARPDPPLSLVAVAGAALALGIPGIACTEALFPGPGLGRAERTVLVLGIQLSLVVVCGFLLHLLRPGLSATSWGALLADVTLVACLTAWIRTRGTTTFDAERDPRPAPGGMRATAPGGIPVAEAATIRSPAKQVAMLAGAALLALFAFGVARAGEAAQPTAAWTALSIESADGGRAVAIGITDAEGRDETYRVVVTLDGEPLTTLAEVPVAHGGSARISVPLPPAGAFLRQVGVSLWRAADAPDADPYRSVRLSLRGAPQP